MDIKAKLRARFAPIPVDLPDPEINGLLFVRRLRVPELQQYMDLVRASKDRGSSEQFHLLGLSVCDSDGQPVFDSPEEAADLLGDCWLPLYEAAGQVNFPGAGTDANPTTQPGTPSAG